MFLFFILLIRFTSFTAQFRSAFSINQKTSAMDTFIAVKSVTFSNCVR